MQDTEIWKDIPNYEGFYQVSNYGRIKSFHKNKEFIKKLGTSTGGYLVASLYNEYTRHTFKVHKLVANAFLNHVPCGHELVVNHKDFDRVNNRVTNLEIVTARENGNLKHRKSTSTFTGVHWSERRNRWVAQITINRKATFLGHFHDEIEASEAYQKALEKHLSEKV